MRRIVSLLLLLACGGFLIAQQPQQPTLTPLLGSVLARSTTGTRGLWMAQNLPQNPTSPPYPPWFSLSGEVVNVKEFGAAGDGVTDDTSAIQAAITAGKHIFAPNGDYKLTSPLTVSANSVSIFGLGRSANFVVAHTGNVFNVSGQDFSLDNVGFTFSQTATRTGSVLINPTNILGKVTNVTVLGSASFNNGGFAGHVVAAGSGGSWTYEHIRFIGGTTWDYLIKTKASSATIAGLVIDDLVAFSTTFTDAGLIFDTLTDTVKLSHSQIVSATSAPAIHVRNTGAGQAPRWLRMIDDSLESTSLGVCLQVDDGRDVRYQNGYLGSCLNAAVLAGGTNIQLSNNIITTVQQHGITIAAAVTGANILGNGFDDGAGLATNNLYDCINVANSTTNFTILGNYFRAPSANKPRYAMNLGGVNVGFFTIEGNDTTAVAWGTAAFNNLSTSAVQRIWNNPGIADVTKDSAGASRLGALIVSAATPSVAAAQIGFGTDTGFGNGGAGVAATTTAKNTGTGPTTPQTIVNYIKVNIAGTDYWLPLMQ